MDPLSGVFAPRGGYTVADEQFTSLEKLAERTARFTWTLGPLPEPATRFVRELLTLRHPHPETFVGATFSTSESRAGNRTIIAHVRGRDIALRLHRMFGQEGPRGRLVGACRAAVEDQTRAFRTRFFAENPLAVDPEIGVPLTPANSDVDHAPFWTFRRIVDRWLAEIHAPEDLSEMQRVLTQDPDVDRDIFTEPRIVRSFAKLHADLATLRVVHSHTNRVAYPAYERWEAENE